VTPILYTAEVALPTPEAHRAARSVLSLNDWRIDEHRVSYKAFGRLHSIRLEWPEGAVRLVADSEAADIEAVKVLAELIHNSVERSSE